MSVEDFIFRVGADVSQFEKSIKDIEAELKKWQNSLKTATGSAIVEANKNISNLQQSMVNLRNVGLDKLPQAANKGAASLNALGQVARDAPFGFIAIQNNLPILFDQFGALSKQSGGVINGLKSIGSALIGPAGVTFAIGAAISAITALIQNYGSFGAAIDAVFGKQTALSIETLEAAKSLQEFNKEFKTSDQLIRGAQAGTEGQSTRIKSLSKIVLDQSKTFDERNSALKELKKIDEEYFYTIDLGKTSYKELTNTVDNYIRTIKFAASAKALENRISETNSQLVTQRQLLKGLENNLDELKRKEINVQGVAATRKDQEDIKQAQSNVNKQIAVINSLETSLNTNKNALNAFIVKQNELRAPVEASTEALKKQEQQLLRNEKATKSGEKKLNQQKQEQQRVDNLYATKKKISEQAKLNKEELDGIRSATKERRKGEREAGAGVFIPKQISTVPPSLNNERILSEARATNNTLERLKKEADLTAAYNLINSTFFAPLDTLFNNFFETGKFAFKEFAQSVLKAISQIVSKIIATGIVTLLASILIPGFSAAGGGLGKTLLSGITGALGFGGGGFGGSKSVAAPNFGGVSGGGLQMAGAVNLQLRGSDLVGAINRTNATINRVG